MTETLLAESTKLRCKILLRRSVSLPEAAEDADIVEDPRMLGQELFLTWLSSSEAPINVGFALGLCLGSSYFCFLFDSTQ